MEIKHDHGDPTTTTGHVHPTDGDGHGDHTTPSTDHEGGHEMRMWFHGGINEYILFEPWRTSNAGGFIGALIGIYVLSVAYEGLKFYREIYYRKFLEESEERLRLKWQQERGQGQGQSQNGPLLNKIKIRMLSKFHILQTLLHVVQFVLAYFLMLIFMTFNIYLRLSIVLGSISGYFFFGWKKSIVIDISDHCH